MDEDVIEIVARCYTTEEILDILDMDCADLCQALSDQILDNIYKFEEVRSFYNGV